MFAPRYFGVRHFGPRYWAPGAGDIIVDQPIPSSRSAPAGGPLLRHKPRIAAYTPAWEHYEEALLQLVEKHGNEKSSDHALMLLQNVAFGPLEEVAKLVFKLKISGVPHKPLIELLYFLSDDEQQTISDLVHRRIEDDEIAILLLDGGL